MVLIEHTECAVFIPNKNLHHVWQKLKILFFKVFFIKVNAVTLLEDTLIEILPLKTFLATLYDMRRKWSRRRDPSNINYL